LCLLKALHTPDPLTSPHTQIVVWERMVSIFLSARWIYLFPSINFCLPAFP
jgi:hypothetical protein